MEFVGDFIKGILKKGKEYDQLVFEGEYSYDKKLENIEQFNSEDYSDNELKIKRWKGKGKERKFQEYLLKLLLEEITKEEYDDIIYEGDYLEGKKTGHGKIYNEKNGFMLYEGELLNCKRHGKGKLYDKKGILEIEGDFINDKADYKNGFIKEYDKNGKLFSETQYSDEIPLRAKHYNEEGNVILDYKDKEIKEYYDNGNLRKEGDYYAGYNGMTKEYYENGKILFEGEEKDNERWNGKIYGENGEIIDEIKDGKSLKNKDKEKKKKK